jgi:hypothetical protein
MNSRSFRTKTEGVTLYWRKLYINEFHNLYSVPDIARTIKSRRMRYVGHATNTTDGHVINGLQGMRR